MIAAKHLRLEDVSAASVLPEHCPVEHQRSVLGLVVEGHQLAAGEPERNGIVVGRVDSAAARINSKKHNWLLLLIDIKIKETERQIGRKTDRQIDRKAERQNDRKTI